MRAAIIIRYIGFVLIFIAGFQLLSAGVSLLYGDSAVFSLLYSAIICFLFGVFPVIYVPKTEFISNNEGLVIVVLSWVFSCLFGMVPYVMWGGEFSFTNAWFESVSGFTTTGSTILNEIESLPKGLLFWRSATQWIGGIGIVIFVLLVLPNIGKARFVLFKSEISDLAQRNLKFASRKALRVLLVVYVGLTFLEVILLWIAGMSLYDAVNHSFTTIATGGFSTRNLSIAYYDNLTIEIIIEVFMVLAGIHFGLLFATIMGRGRSLYRNQVVRYYLLSIIMASLLISLNLYIFKDYEFLPSLRFSFFQVISLGTSTGFANIDTAAWPPFSIIILLFFTLQCACAGSTSGGIKTDRMLVFFKSISNQMIRLHHPRAVLPVKIGRWSVEPEAASSAVLYVAVYLLVVFVATVIITAFNVDTLSAFSASVATMGNVGPGFATVSSLGNFAGLPVVAKWVLTLTMLIGRLEIYGILSLLMFKKR